MGKPFGHRNSCEDLKFSSVWISCDHFVVNVCGSFMPSISLPITGVVLSDLSQARRMPWRVRKKRTTKITGKCQKEPTMTLFSECFLPLLNFTDFSFDWEVILLCKLGVFCFRSCIFNVLIKVSLGKLLYYLIDPLSYGGIYSTNNCTKKFDENVQRLWLQEPVILLVNMWSFLQV